ncbi:MAG: hypothetical protein ACRDLS_11925 [Solirubrobacteraceae bacterium]
MRWHATHADKVQRWRVSLDGHVVATMAARRTTLTRRIARNGRHTWRVVGFDAAAKNVVAARRSFRAT